jgi:hypothetical protein
VSRIVWPERAGDTCRLVVDTKAAAAAGFTPDSNGRLVISFDALGLITHAREIDEIRTGLLLALLYPATRS